MHNESATARKKGVVEAGVQFHRQNVMTKRQRLMHNLLYCRGAFHCCCSFQIKLVALAAFRVDPGTFVTAVKTTSFNYGDITFHILGMHTNRILVVTFGSRCLRNSFRFVARSVLLSIFEHVDSL